MNFNTALERLKKHCPLPEPFVIEEITDDPFLGYCRLSINGFVIEINIDIDEVNQIETLVHEWAHALRFVKPPHALHDSLFGIEYARCYRAAYFDTSEDDDLRAWASFLGFNTIILPEDKKYRIPRLEIKT